MSKINKSLHTDAMNVLYATSRTFFIPINGLPSELKEAVAASYLCMRAIDEIEDHPDLTTDVKVNLLQSVSKFLQGSPNEQEVLEDIFFPYQSQLPEVTLRLTDWIQFCPSSIRPTVCRYTAIMAEGMAKWAAKGWQVQTEEDLDEYTYYVAGLVGLMLNEIWKWHDGTESDEKLAVAYGRGLQAVNILRNQNEDATRDVNYFPKGWTFADMMKYAKRNLGLADIYTANITSPPILKFCKIPLALAHGTVEVMESGKEKLSRFDVMKIVGRAIKGL
ncbi:squalene/phytoene synthase family protein [Risungbinella massiliensis]|uniref:squalene/phytoene synthase family protein n=1 Tax=Risungbinella massiliensis TaxID=1329796 RepID=UPI0005CBDC91|nr:phytoene/squalene synthase family protein [Risungbinella massiliensis]